MKLSIRLQNQNTENNYLRDSGMRLDIIAYNILIFAIGIFKVGLDLKV